MLRDLERAVSAPLAASTFWDNMRRAYDLYRLRIPADPYEAEVRFCGLPPLQHALVEATGGTRFRWLCPKGLPFAAIKGDLDATGQIAGVRAVCGVMRAEDAASERMEGPRFGATDDAKIKSSFAVTCPGDSTPSGLYGTSDGMVRSLGLLCSNASGGVAATSSGGTEAGRSFTLPCPQGTTPAGIEGRAGDLVDSIGVTCEVSDQRTAAGAPRSSR
jgi:hypothetical protein